MKQPSIQDVLVMAYTAGYRAGHDDTVEDVFATTRNPH